MWLKKSIILSCLCGVAYAETLTPEQVMQRVFDHYPSINIAAIEIERARQTIKVVNNQLGWQLSAQAGFERGIGLFGTASDTVSMGAGLSRMLDSGSNITIDGGVRHEDSETVFSPAIPNPATSSNIGVSYRQSLGRNTAHSVFQASKISAKLDVELALAKTDEMYDQLALKVIDLYFSAAGLLAKIDNIDQSIKRSKRLQDYIKNKTSLGVTEQKDILQVNAQLNSLIAEKSNLEISWAQQMVAMNRLMERPWDSPIKTTYRKTPTIKKTEDLFLQAKEYNPGIKLMESKLALANSAIQTRRDERENAIDLVWFAGSQSYKGDTLSGSTSENDLTGGLRLEYKQTVDKSGVDAELYQAQLERDIVLQDRKLLLENLHYDLSSLMAEIDSNKSALGAYEKSLLSEQIKSDEAMKRYRSGRIDTDVLIQFEAQLSNAKFALELQRISLMQRYYKLQVMLGDIWNVIEKPASDALLTDSSTGAESR